MPKRRALSHAEASRLAVAVAAGKPCAGKAAVLLGLSLGARLGEVLGLTWGHVHADAPHPYVQIIQQHTRAGERTALKTDADDNPIGRVVPLDLSTLTALDAWRAAQRAYLNMLGIEQGNDTPIVTSARGCWMDHAKFTHWFENFCVSQGFGRWVADDGREVVSLMVGEDAALHPDDCYIIEWRDAEGWPCDEHGNRYSRSHKRPQLKKHYDGLVFHELRHTHFTMRLASGMDIPTAQALGGWSTPDMLVSVYSHPVNEGIWSAPGFIDGLAVKEVEGVS